MSFFKTLWNGTSPKQEQRDFKGLGRLYLDPDGTVEYWAVGKGFGAAFSVGVRDVTGFSVRKPSRDDKKRLDIGFLEEVLNIQGSGTTLAEVVVTRAEAKQIEAWFRAQPDFGANNRSQAAPTAAPLSVADELIKLVQLRDAGVLSPAEFEVQKARLLSTETQKAEG